MAETGTYKDGKERSGPIGGDCDKQGCKRAAYHQIGPVKTCGDHQEWAEDRFPVKEFECENGHSFKGRSAYTCPECGSSRAYLITEVGERVPV